MNEPNTAASAEKPQSRADAAWSPMRLIWTVALVLAVVGLIVAASWPGSEGTREESEKLMLQAFGLHKPVENHLAGTFTDANSDLVADAPTDAAKLVQPPELIFSYIASSKDAEKQAAVWKDFVDDLAKRTSRPVKQVAFATVDAQLKALRDGQLHVTGFNTGNVPFAVNACGFVPVSAPGRDDGTAGITMQWIVPADSNIAKPADLKGHKFTFTDTTSNSGFKAPAVLLLSDFKLAPERDYTWGFSYSHEDSIKGICSGDFEVAAVASDMIARAIADPASGIKAEQFRVIYNSSPFPPAALGYAHNLTPDLAAAIKASLLEFKFAGTGLEKEFGANVTRFVPVSYKDDFIVVRRIDDTLGRAHVLP